MTDSTDKTDTVEDGTKHHYFASCAFGWKTANTREEAINGLIHYFRRELITPVKNLHKRGEPGAYIWTCKVLEPADAEYSIEFYSPKGVEKSDGQDHYVTYLTLKESAYWTQP